MKNVPRVMIAAVRSGSGKTSISTGLMGALKRRGYRVQGFKVGPDFIDPSYHTAVTERFSRNLDTWMLSCGQVQDFFRRAAEDADLAVIEGVMGVFDGLRGQGERASSAEVAKLLGCPVILVLDVHAQARSAVVEFVGCRAFDPDLLLKGVILNRVQGPGHLKMLEQSFEEAGIPVLGAVQKDSLPRLTERHLGLVPVPEQQGDAGGVLDEFAEKIAEQVDLEKILQIARSAPRFFRPLPFRRSLFEERGKDGGQRLNLKLRKGISPAAGKADSQSLKGEDSGDRLNFYARKNRKVRVALAWDRAFNFYYRDGLELLEEFGVELVTFSPLKDSSLPSDVGGVIIGGGFPELFAKDLAENEKMKESLRLASAQGMPLYAECGGFMYLCDGLSDLEGKIYPMVGLVPGVCRMEKRLIGMGYVVAQSLRENILCKKGDLLRGHEFHYSSFTPRNEEHPWAFSFTKAGGYSRPEGYALGNLLASYLHFHFAAKPAAVRRFASCCRAFVEDASPS